MNPRIIIQRGLCYQSRLPFRPCHRYYSKKNEANRFPIFNYLKNLKWTPIPVGVGLAYICYQQYGKIKLRERKKIEASFNEYKIASDFEVSLMRAIPLKMLSRFAGWLAEKEMPVWLRDKFFSWYIKKYNCDMSEALEEDHLQYNTFQKFFRRKLKPDSREIDSDACVVSPSDGTILHFGELTGEKLEQIKGITYPLQDFIGPVTWKKADPQISFSNNLLKNCNNVLYHCVIYLNPGNYHHFHSPTEWNVHFCRHFAGELISTMPSFVKWLKNLYCLNERVVCIGEWKHGFFSMVPVGATNVGSIEMNFDKGIQTNKSGIKIGSFDDYHYEANNNPSKMSMKKGESFGEFKLGSTIVLVFEGPKDLKCKLSSGQSIRYGQKLYVES